MRGGTQEAKYQTWQTNQIKYSVLQRSKTLRQREPSRRNQEGAMKLRRDTDTAVGTAGQRARETRTVRSETQSGTSVLEGRRRLKRVSEG